MTTGYGKFEISIDFLLKFRLLWMTGRAAWLQAVLVPEL